MRIVTWNVISLRVRLPRVLRLLAERKPDVVCLQETKSAPEAFPVAELAGPRYGAVHDSGGRWAGVAEGLIDAYRTLHPTQVQYTWWDYREGSFHKGLGMRLDLALISAGPAPRLRACGIDREYRKGTKPSHHAPLLLDLAGPGH